MIAEMNQVKRYLGARFGYGEPIPNGIYAVPAETSKGPAFMRMEIKDGNPAGNSNFKLFWDEALTKSWYDAGKSSDLKESRFSKAFRKLDKITP